MMESRGVGLPDLTGLTAPWFAADGQGDDGAVSDITPTVWQLGAMQPSDASWGSAFPTMAHQVWPLASDQIKRDGTWGAV
jgi:hypothetical protein